MLPAHDRDVADAADFANAIFDFARGHVFATDLESVFVAVLIEEVAFFAEHHHVTGLEPAVFGKRLLHGFFVVVVLEEELDAAATSNPKFPDLTFHAGLARIAVHDRELIARRGLPHRTVGVRLDVVVAGRMNDGFRHSPRSEDAELQPVFEVGHNEAKDADLEFVLRDRLRGDRLEDEGDE